MILNLHGPLANKNAKTILTSLLFDGPGNPYQIEKRVRLAHSTFWDAFSPLAKRDYIEIVSSKPFRTGRRTKYYRISSYGFLSLLDLTRNRSGEDDDSRGSFPLVRPSDRVWTQVEHILLENRYLFPWLSDQIKSLQSTKAPELARCLITIYTYKRPTSKPLLERGEDGETLAEFATFIVGILYPGTYPTYLGFLKTHAFDHFVGSKPSSQTLTALRNQIKEYLRLSRSLSEYIVSQIDASEARLDRIRSQIGIVRAELTVLLSPPNVVR
jgi:hypothetical protein